MKKIIVVFLFSIFALSLFAFDFGGSLDTSFLIFDENKIPSKDSYMALSETASLWIRHNFSNWISFSMEGNYSASYDFKKFSQNLNLDFLKLKMNFAPSSVAEIGVDLGRFHVSDSTSLVLNGLIDGAQVKILLPEVDFSLFGGYTGLLNAKSVSIVNSTVEKTQDSLYGFAPKYLLGGISLFATNYYGNHSVGCDFSTFIPVDSRETRTSSFYVGFDATGPVFSSLYYDVSAILSLFAGENVNTGFLVDGLISYYAPFLSSVVSLNATYATDSFCPFSNSSVVMGGVRDLSGLLKLGLVSSIKPFSNFLVVISGDYLMDDVDSKLTSFGFQWYANLKWQILSDLQFSLYCGQLLPLHEEVAPQFASSASFVINF